MLFPGMKCFLTHIPSISNFCRTLKPLGTSWNIVNLLNNPAILSYLHMLKVPLWLHISGPWLVAWLIGSFRNFLYLTFQEKYLIRFPPWRAYAEQKCSFSPFSHCYFLFIPVFWQPLHRSATITCLCVFLPIWTSTSFLRYLHLLITRKWVSLHVNNK